ncbi:alpha/beta-hydrolase [Pilatotrama ljubarskyi]|nr:alpha/beta-hydrolase [Pilatotrama ljubarskyi]
MLTSPLHALLDSGIPATGSTECTTVVILHGYAWHSGSFSKLIPCAHPRNARVLLVNRRDYPGSQPYTEADRGLLQALTPDAVAAAEPGVETFTKARARELYDFLVELVKRGDPPYHHLGDPSPEPPLYNPLFDEELLPKDREPAYTKGVSGYYVHGDTLDTLERKAFLPDPRPTLYTLTLEDIGRTMCLSSGGPGGSEEVLLHTGIGVGLFRAQRDYVIYIADSVTHVGDAWRDVEVRYVWCERSICEVVWGAKMLRKEVGAARVQGLPIRKVRIVFIRGANHLYVQWDQPELALLSLVGNVDRTE